MLQRMLNIPNVVLNAKLVQRKLMIGYVLKLADRVKMNCTIQSYRVIDKPDDQLISLKSEKKRGRKIKKVAEEEDEI